MVIKTVAPYGQWDSVISLDDSTAGSKSLSSPRGDVRTGRVFYLESKPNGANNLVEVITHGDGSYELGNVLPEPHSVSTSVYEYGGGAYDVIPVLSSHHHQRIIFSDGKDGNALKLLDVDSGLVTVLVSGKPWLRYSDFGVNEAPDGTANWVVAVEEDHSQPEPQDVRNYVVAINIDTGHVKRVIAGADFYTNPRFSRDGRWVAWRTWDHPEMPWTTSKLCWARVVVAAGSVEPQGDGLSLGVDSAVVAGGKPGEPVGEAAWGPDGALYFTHEVDGNDWRQMFRIWPGKDAKAEKLKLKGLKEVEIGNCSMSMDSRTFGFFSKRSMVLSYNKYGIYSTAHVNLETLEVTNLDLPLIDLSRDSISVITPNSFLAIGAGSDIPHGVYHVTIDPKHKHRATTKLVVSAYSKSYPPGLFSQPEHIQITSKGDPKRPIHGFFWPPYNPKFTAPAGTLPPLLVNPHGGPTGHSTAGLKIGSVAGGNAPFWTSRGFAYFVLNYTGSTGHGHAYRQALDGQWGLLDRDDVPECVDYLCAATTGAPRADRSRVGIHGGSAGGFNVLQGLVWYPDVFAAGVSYCGVSMMRGFSSGTHKLESHYLESLLYRPGMTEEERDRVDEERSPALHAARIRAPLLLVHGEDDTVVPVRQSYDVERRLRESGGEVKLVVVPGEGHMFSKNASKKLGLEAEVEWFMRTLT